MFNRNDDHSDDWEACCRVVARVKQHPRDYFIGLPDAPLLIPKNILVFSRQKAFDEGTGTAHHRYLLIICLRGEASVIVDEHVVRLKPGSGVLVAPHQFHHYARFSGEKVLWLFVSFELEDVEEFKSFRGMRCDVTPLQVTCLTELAERYANSEVRQESNASISALLALILQEFRGGPARGKELPQGADHVVPSRKLMQDVARYVHRHVAEALQIEDVARAMGLSESHLRARFRTLAGIGLGAYIRRLRLHRARTLMIASDSRLKEIAEQCGYESIYAFSRTFHKEMGISPSAYRKSFFASAAKSQFGQQRRGTDMDEAGSPLRQRRGRPRPAHCPVEGRHAVRRATQHQGEHALRDKQSAIRVTSSHFTNLL
ncbi:MAG: AraC family transcriptional regulator [bacterium]